MFPAQLHFVAESLFRRFGSYETPSTLEGLVISPGGVASTSVMEYVQTFVNINDAGDRDGLKHRPKPPAKQSQSIPVLLITGSAETIIPSLERRGYLPHQAIRLGCWTYFIVPRRFRQAKLSKAIERQKRRWSHHKGPILLVEFEDLWDHASDIANLFKISDMRFSSEFPKRKGRASF